MRIKKFYTRFSRWYVFGKLYDPGIELPTKGLQVELSPVRARPSKIRITTSLIEVCGDIEGRNMPGLHLTLHARAGATTLSAPARIDWSEQSGSGTAHGVFKATLNVPPASHGRINLKIEMPDGTHRQQLLSRYNQHDLARIAGGMYRGFWRFVGIEVLPRTLDLLIRKRRLKARQAISRALDTQPFFAAGARRIDVRASFATPSGQGVKPAMPPVDIVVPVFNGYECLAGFFRRLGRMTQRKGVHIWIIDDQSSDPRIWPYLTALAESNAFAGRSTLLRNDTNLGFPGTVNRGLALAKHDAVILNTDIKLPRKWLPRLVAPLADDKVASATPFSNRATLVSFPAIDKDNDLPLGLKVDAIDQVFATVDPLAWQLDLPTGVGFCMALSRRFLDRIGGFDAQAFGRGYGEENDWCQRAVAVGGRNVLVSNLFVEHDHGLSYPSQEKKQLLVRNLQLLNRRHPRYHAEVAAFLTADPALPLRASMFARLCCSPAAGGVEIFFDHSLGGGANWYRDERLKPLRDAGKPSIVVSGQRDSKDLYAVVEAGGTIMRLALTSFADLDHLIPPGRHVRIIYNCAVGFAGAAEIPAFLARRAREMNNVLEIALHDYFPICPSYTLLDADGKFCGVPDDIAHCHRCLERNPHGDLTIERGGIVQWRGAWGELLGLAETIKAFSQSSARLLTRAYPDLDGRVIIEPHAHMERLRSVARPPIVGRATIAVIGSIGFAKGAALVREAARIIRSENLPVRLLIIGEMALDFHDPAIVVTRRYVRTELPDLVEQHGVHMVWFSSIWPETFSYVTEEVMDMGLPLACFDIGAPAERVRTYEHGLVIDRRDARRALMAMIDHLKPARAA